MDDLVIIEADLIEINCVKTQFSNAFKMKDFGNLHYFLGIEVIHIPEGILLAQCHYVLTMLFKFGMTEC